MKKSRGAGINCGFKVFIFVSLALTAVMLHAPFARAAEADDGLPYQGQAQVTLNAERVSYDDKAGQAAADGNAVLTYEGATIRADRIDYDAVSQKVKASASSGGLIALESMGRTVAGRSLDYDLVTQEGVLDGVKSELNVGNGTLYVLGDGMQVMPYELAVERGLVSGRSGGALPAYAGFAENVSVTTCVLDHPHYRIETKSMIFIPGELLIAKKPRLYLGESLILTYPMDYVVRIDRSALKHQIMPYVESSEVKGTGVGMNGALAWESGSLELGLGYWSTTGVEWMAEVEQSIGGGFSVTGGVEYTWNEAWNEKQYSPYTGLFYRSGGWEASLRFSWNEYMEIQQDTNHRYMGRLDREPEFTVYTPWFKDPALDLSWFRLIATAGSYRESTPLWNSDRIVRYGAELQSYFEYPMGTVTFFSNTTYGAWFYDKDSLDQEILNAFVGFHYNLGSVELASGYERRYVWGESPMSWDDGMGRERFHQKIRVPLGKELYLAVQGSYDFDESKVDGVQYALQLVNDCMKWELRYYDDRTSGSDSRIGLGVSILAYPNTPASFGQKEYDDPFEPPVIPERDK